ncbi:MAG: flippase-like domain-containing protein [Candidatus Cloacimonetes bacterium]|nr:flippase-like domain-containing protein [Candidatus Cloacimonadota bacterium]
MKRKNIISLILGLLLGIVLLLLWLRFVDITELTSRMKEVRLTPVILSLVCYMLAYFIRSFRWYLLIPKEVNVGVLRTWLISLSGNFINYLIPIRAGELAKAWLLKRQRGLPVMQGLSGIFVDKSFDTIGILVVLLLLPFLKVRFSGGMLGLLGILVIVFAVSFLVLILAIRNSGKVSRILQALFSWLPKRVKTKTDGYIEAFVQGMATFRHQPGKLLAAMGLTALGLVFDGLYFWLIFIAFGITYPFAMVLFGYTLINLSYALPQPPAQLGSNEWMMIIIFSAGFGLTKPDASAVMAFAHIFTAAVIVLTGIISLSINGGQLLSKIFKGETLDE